MSFVNKSIYESNNGSVKHISNEGLVIFQDLLLGVRRENLRMYLFYCKRFFVALIVSLNEEKYSRSKRLVIVTLQQRVRYINSGILDTS
jgi:hypothetical protein